MLPSQLSVVILQLSELLLNWHRPVESVRPQPEVLGPINGLKFLPSAFHWWLLGLVIFLPGSGICILLVGRGQELVHGLRLGKRDHVLLRL